MTIPQVTFAITIGSIAILNAVLFWFMPRLTRRDLYFAVTVPPGFRDEPEGRSILRRYRIELVVVAVAAFILFIAGLACFGIRFVAAGPLLQAAAAFIAFYRARQRVRPSAVAPTTIREAVLHNGDWIIPGGWVAATGPFILVAAFAVYGWVHGTASQVQYTGPRLAPTVSVLFFTTAGTLAPLSLMLYGLTRWVRPLHAVGPEHRRELKFRRTMSTVLLAIEYLIAIQASWIVLVRHHAGLRVVLLPAFFILILIAAVRLARLGQGGNRIPAADEEPAAASTAVAIGDRTPDHCWKLGIFYFNRDDSAILVEKRFGLGYSLNFARPMAWIVVSLLVLGPLIPILAHFL